MKFLKLFLTVALILSTTFVSGAQSKKITYKTSRNYEIVMQGVGTDGTKVFVIYTTAKKVEQAIALGKKAAVEVCIFRGLPSAGTVNATPPICDAKTEQAHEDYFENFFSPGGQYLRYVNITSDGDVNAQDRMKIKGGWKVGLLVQVMYDNLRKDLEADGIAKSLSSGF